MDAIDDKLRIVLTPEESIVLTPEESEEVVAVAITFTVWKGRIIIGEEWEGMDEIWSDGVSIHIPRRVWDEGAAWLSAKLGFGDLSPIKAPSA